MCSSMFYRYYEVEVLTTGDMHVGWARISADPSAQLGSEPNSYGFDGYMVSFLKHLENAWIHHYLCRSIFSYL